VAGRRQVGNGAGNVSSDIERQASLQDGTWGTGTSHDHECTTATPYLRHHLRVSSRRGRHTANVAGKETVDGCASTSATAMVAQVRSNG